MADLRVPRGAAAVGTDGHARDIPGGDMEAIAGSTIDPRAVRARLSPASAVADEPPMRVSPPARPLRMTNPTVGRGMLGGAAAGAVDAEPGDDGTGVLAQRHWVVDDEPVVATLEPAGHGRHLLAEGDERTRVVLEPSHQETGGIRRREVLVDGFRFEIDVEAERVAALRERAGRGRAASAHSGPLEVRAIIPGKVVSVSIATGDAVTAGQQLLVVEAMKMQNELRAPRDGTIERVGVAQGVNIEVGDLLVVIS